MIASPGDPLRCPRCSAAYLHHGAVEVYTRPTEDAQTRAMIIQDGIIKPGTPELNPSPRRHGLVITFWCENCHIDEGRLDEARRPEFRLAIYQHKGQTFLEWIEPNP